MNMGKQLLKSLIGKKKIIIWTTTAVVLVSVLLIPATTGIAKQINKPDGSTQYACPAPKGNQNIVTAYITGYSADEGSTTDIAFPNSHDSHKPHGIHKHTGGNGTCENPISAAVPPKNLKQFPPGTVFYIQAFKKYFIVEDQCGEVGGSCDQEDDRYHFDLWTASNACSEAITKNYRVIVNPRGDHMVAIGPLACDEKYDNEVQYQGKDHKHGHNNNA
jgi:hypothetical protein